MRKVTLFNMFVSSQDHALRFYVDQLEFEVAEDKHLGDYRWLLVRASANREVCLNLEAASTDEEKALVGRQTAGQPFFSLNTDDCLRDYAEFKRRGVKFKGEPQGYAFRNGCHDAGSLRATGST